jgi:nucleotide-binding universal stress UspA family protein
MTDAKTELAIRRILVALDASANSLAALEQAAMLAAGMEAELVGLFVEDINLLRIAALPFARQICYPSGAKESMDCVKMERELRVRAEHAREALAAVAERAQAPWSFRITRGQVTAEILAAASEADLVLLGKAGWSPARSPGLGSTALAIAASAPRALLLVQHGAHLGNHIITVYDGSNTSRKAAQIAVRLAGMRQHSLTVFILADSPEKGEQMERDIKTMANGHVNTLRFRTSYSAGLRHLAEAFQAEADGLVVMGTPSPFLNDETIGMLLGAIPNSVLLIR